ncbi:sugar transferase [Amphibacillus jilinensis]|uniref:sugar transferase n=1 Tax=Amphibacillus jilinensis TaxID=1216008 RepID=UPI0006885DB2|nr:sugar transferase [Amphibacillus jilinensis]
MIPVNESRFYRVSKRCIDLIIAGVGLIMLSPVFLIIGFLIKLDDSQTSIFFSQERLGKDGKSFNMYKFRSMVPNAEALKHSLLANNEVTGPVFKMKKDPRITKIGKFIRKTSIDELPQLINVLKGEMSLVGPRPPLPDEVLKYSSYQMQRLKVVPGLTCYWQISGRSDLDFEEWVYLDLKYISERNLLIDLKLIVRTVVVLCGSNGAY